MTEPQAPAGDAPPPPPPPPPPTPSRWTNWFRVILPSAVLLTLSFALAWHFVQPAPPKHVVIATGSSSGAYYAFAKQYADYFAANGIRLEVRETAGSIANYGLLMAAGSGVDLAIVQGGSAPPGARRAGIEAIAGIYDEPVLVFYRGSRRPTRVSQLGGLRIAIGNDGSGVRVMALSLLTGSGVTDGDPAGTRLTPEVGDAAADALSQGRVDAAFFVIAPTAPVVARLLATPDVHLMSFEQARAYGRRDASLAPVTLVEGSVDVARNLPDADVQLVAAPATVVMRAGTHQGVVELTVDAVEHFHAGGTLLSDAGAFPVPNRTDLRQNADARYFLTNKPSILRRTFPFWLASMIDRLLIMLLPLLVVLVPLSRLVPPLMRWNTQRRILVWYQRVGEIDKQVTPQADPATLRRAHLRATAIENDLVKLRVPLSYSQELYNLRVHVTYVRSRIDRLEQAAQQGEKV